MKDEMYDLWIPRLEGVINILKSRDVSKYEREQIAYVIQIVVNQMESIHKKIDWDF